VECDDLFTHAVERHRWPDVADDARFVRTAPAVMDMIASSGAASAPVACHREVSRDA